jgi:tetratricopeptide (TPR) repeat protein
MIKHAVSSTDIASLVKLLAIDLQKEMLGVAEQPSEDRFAEVQARVEQVYDMYDAALQAEREHELHERDVLLASDIADPDLLFQAALTSLKHGALDEAASFSQQALQLAPESVGARVLQGRILLLQGRPGDALDVCRPLLQNQMSESRICSDLGNIMRAAGDIDGAVRMFRIAAGLAQGPQETTARVELGITLLAQAKLDEAIVQFEMKPQAVAWQNALVCHLTHEAEQIEHLVARGIIGIEHQEFSRLLRRIDAEYREPGKMIGDITLTDAEKSLLNRLFPAIVHHPRCDIQAESAINPNLDVAGIEAAYTGALPEMVVADDFLRPSALKSLRDYCLEASVWKYGLPGGYMGAIPEHGFCPPLLLQIAEELRARFPRIMKDYILLRFWAFKYDQRMVGIPVHADPAMVNVNFWLTPDSANNDAATGGMVVWDKAAPPDWGHAEQSRGKSITGRIGL